ncbi:hypothetical protein [Mucisphaera calidilacus]|uniref:Glycosyltransferase RgtA/B/C/D-like domain-containing protein n=1 Tax=Mucisphaera calidilacus TaxID=2527982 RepID=A0A518BZ87_9BACT|nr:hypothetical protein [Mucisphaera calidilacus]QDU72279.1 hypothetical protein Pan265_21430 [Mucisphaera calidilacus]
MMRAAVGLAAVTALSSWLAVHQGVLPLDVWASVDQVRVLVVYGLPVAVLWLAAYGFGAEMVRGLYPSREGPADGLNASVAGMGLLLVGHWVNSMLIGLAGWIVWLLVGPLVLAGVWHLWRARGVLRAYRPGLSVLLLGLPLGVLLAAACAPAGTLWRVEAYGYDVLSYHLQLPREWMATAYVQGFEHNVYSFFPSLVESGYTLIPMLAGRDDVATLVYSGQLLHASFALVAALCVARLVGRGGADAGWVAGAAFLAVPWVLVTGSLAYNEMAVVAFGALALDRALRPGREALVDGLMVGGLLGVATVCKLTAGPMVGVPVAVIGVVRWWRLGRSAEDLKTFGLCVVVAGGLVLVPYFWRNASATGNPVFPFAAEVLGSGHWGEAEVERWDRAHMASASEGSVVAALDRQLLRNTGFGAAGGWPVPVETQNIARFDREGGFPLVWPLVLLGLVVGLVRREDRLVAGSMAGMVLWQLLFWGVTTHHQSRFLIPLLLPGMVLAGLVLRWVSTMSARAVVVAGAVWVMSLWLVGMTALWEQSVPVRPEGAREAFPAPLAWVLGSLERGALADHPINALPEGCRVYLVADASRLLYLEGAFVYESAFDRSSMGDWVRIARGDGPALDQVLRNVEVTHLWVHWGELARLHGTYGYDPDVTESELRAMTSGWPVVADVGAATLYRVPEAVVDETQEMP